MSLVGICLTGILDKLYTYGRKHPILGSLIRSQGLTCLPFCKRLPMSLFTKCEKLSKGHKLSMLKKVIVVPHFLRKKIEYILTWTEGLNVGIFCCKQISCPTALCALPLLFLACWASVILKAVHIILKHGPQQPRCYSTMPGIPSWGPVALSHWHPWHSSAWPWPCLLRSVTVRPDSLGARLRDTLSPGHKGAHLMHNGPQQHPNLPLAD